MWVDVIKECILPHIKKNIFSSILLIYIKNIVLYTGVQLFVLDFKPDNLSS